jgi:Domain of unknown function (DUF397)
MNNGDCVEVASVSDTEIGVRDSKDPRGAILKFTPAEWDMFIDSVRNGEFDRRYLTSIYAGYSKGPLHTDDLIFTITAGFTLLRGVTRARQVRVSAEKLEEERHVRREAAVPDTGDPVRVQWPSAWP